VTCPHNITRAITAKRRVTFGAAFTGCPFRDRCTTSPRGRKLVLHEHDALQREHRQRAADPAFQDAYRTHRPMVERSVAWQPPRSPPRYHTEQRLAAPADGGTKPAQTPQPGAPREQRKLDPGLKDRLPPTMPAFLMEPLTSTNPDVRCPAQKAAAPRTTKGTRTRPAKEPDSDARDALIHQSPSPRARRDGQKSYGRCSPPSAPVVHQGREQDPDDARWRCRFHVASVAGVTQGAASSRAVLSQFLLKLLPEGQCVVFGRHVHTARVDALGCQPKMTSPASRRQRFRS
jgi:hypothetical protein